MLVGWYSLGNIIGIQERAWSGVRSGNMLLRIHKDFYPLRPHIEQMYIPVALIVTD